MKKKRTAADLKSKLKVLTHRVSQCIALIDELMKLPSNTARSHALAKVMNELDMANDSALHFGLDMSFEKIVAEKKAERARVQALIQKEMRSW